MDKRQIIAWQNETETKLVVWPDSGTLFEDATVLDHLAAHDSVAHQAGRALVRITESLGYTGDSWEIVPPLPIEEVLVLGLLTGCTVGITTETAEQPIPIGNDDLPL